MRLKKYYSAREVAGLTGLTARQLQWWDAHRLFQASVPSRPTDAGGFTERRYTPMDLLELMVLADLRRHGVSVAALRRLLSALKTRFGVRLYEAIGSDGPVTLLTDGPTSTRARRRASSTTCSRTLTSRCSSSAAKAS